AQSQEPPPINPPAQDAGAGKDKEKDEKDKDKPAEPVCYSVHGQATVLSQGNWPFRSPYFGSNSLLPNLNYRTTETTTLFLAGRVIPNGEIIFNPEVAGGGGLSGTTGMAGFPNGEATRVGVPQPTPYIARLFWKQRSEERRVGKGWRCGWGGVY